MLRRHKSFSREHLGGGGVPLAAALPPTPQLKNGYLSSSVPHPLLSPLPPLFSTTVAEVTSERLCSLNANHITCGLSGPDGVTILTPMVVLSIRQCFYLSVTTTIVRREVENVNESTTGARQLVRLLDSGFPPQGSNPSLDHLDALESPFVCFRSSYRVLCTGDQPGDSRGMGVFLSHRLSV